MARISILMPTYNREPILRMIMPSVMGQTFKDWKLILVDDGSEDGTEQYIAKLKDSRIEYHHQENRGVTATRNVLLGLADTEYACWLDSDDKMNKYRLQLLVSAMDQYQPSYIRTGQTFWRGDNDKMWMLPPTLLWHGGVCVASVCFRPKQIVKFNEDIRYGGEDMEWECRMQEHFGMPIKIPLALYVIGERRGAGRLSKLHKNEDTATAAASSTSLAKSEIAKSVVRMQAAGKKKGETKVPFEFLSSFFASVY
jgi:glycosyltransferase involved in cell wall biosynthesis